MASFFSPMGKDNFLKNIGIVLLVLLTITSLVALYGRPLEKTEAVSLSKVVQEIQAGHVESIEVKQEELAATLNNSPTKLITQKESDVSVTETLRNLGVTEEQLRNLKLTVQKPSGVGFWFSTLVPLLLPFLLLGGFLWFMMRSAQSASNRALSFGQMTSRPIDAEKGKKRTMFHDVAGNEEAKNELQEVVEFLKTPQKFLRLGARIPKGVLLVGPPGTGKTLMARAVAGEASVPFFSISGSDFVEMFVGVGASRVRDLFRKVKRNSPAILFIDELDAVGRQRGAGLGGGHDEREQTLNQILVEMDGFEQTDNVIVLAATNRPDVLDPALLRPGRFDRQVVMELPDIKEREAILKIHIRKVPLSPEVNLRNIAERTPGFSGADLANLINEAAILASRRDQESVTQVNLAESIEKVLLGPEKRSKVLSPHEKAVTAFHEAGHAVVAYHMPHTDPVRKISIIARGHAGGYTLKLPEEDRHLHTRSQFYGELATLMGGYVAEFHKFQEITTGASNDLKKATNLARRIVTEFGMSDLGPVTFGQKDEYIFLGKELHEARNYSESTAAKIDEQILKLLATAREKAREILQRYNSKLELIARTLIEKETIEQVEFQQLMSDDAARAAAPEKNLTLDHPRPSTQPAPA
ncbi:MAG: ATP-dependent zinc metalloprotease FtsH [Candidatus Andersenbacteria bacterium]